MELVKNRGAMIPTGVLVKRGEGGDTGTADVRTEEGPPAQDAKVRGSREPPGAGRGRD